MKELKMMLLKFLDFLVKLFLAPIEIPYILFLTIKGYLLSKKNSPQKKFYRTSLDVSVPTFFALLAMIGGVCALFLLYPSSLVKYLHYDFSSQLFLYGLFCFFLKKAEGGMLKGVLRKIHGALNEVSIYAGVRVWLGAEKVAGAAQRWKGTGLTITILLGISFACLNHAAYAFFIALGDHLAAHLHMSVKTLLSLLMIALPVLTELYIQTHRLCGHYPVDNEHARYGDCLYYAYQEPRHRQTPLFTKVDDGLVEGLLLSEAAAQRGGQLPSFFLVPAAPRSRANTTSFPLVPSPRWNRQQHTQYAHTRPTVELPPPTYAQATSPPQRSSSFSPHFLTGSVQSAREGGYTSVLPIFS